MSYVTVTLEDFKKRLEPKGFKPQFDKAEVYFDRDHERDPNIKVRVYTSIPRGKTVSQGVGEDAVRICLVYVDNFTSRGLCKTKRVNRTGSPDGIIDRALDRAREMWQTGNSIKIFKPSRRNSVQ